MNWKKIENLPQQNLYEILIWVHFGNPDQGGCYKGFSTDGKLGGFPERGIATHYCEITCPEKTPSSVKTQLIELIKNQQWVPGLHLLSTVWPDAILLIGQYNTGKKNYELGLIDESEFKKIKQRIGFALIDQTEKLK